ncbi:MAG: DMT family transporter [Planctomycetota bacterium]
MAASPPRAPTALLTALALVAFAGNSILCRMALADGEIGPISFTCVRLASGALVLTPVFLRARGKRFERGWQLAPLALFVYAFAFSLAYTSLTTGTGALLLFGAVQGTMLGYGRVHGERLRPAQLAGLAAGMAGVVVLVAPGVAAPDPAGVVLMLLAGVSWGIYSLIGRGARHPVASTARNFVLAAPLALLALPFSIGSEALEARGFLLAAASGAVTSGGGYVLWYSALRGHSATSAAVLQLAVPALTAAGGVLLLGEALTGRLVGASVLTLGGILTTIRAAR